MLITLQEQRKIKDEDKVYTSLQAKLQNIENNLQHLCLPKINMEALNPPFCSSSFTSLSPCMTRFEIHQLRKEVENEPIRGVECLTYHSRVSIQNGGGEHITQKGSFWEKRFTWDKEGKERRCLVQCFKTVCLCCPPCYLSWSLSLFSLGLCCAHQFETSKQKLRTGWSWIIIDRVSTNFKLKG